MTTSVRECRLRNNALSKLHHQKPKLENEIMCQSRHERKSHWRNELKNKHRGYCDCDQQQFQQQFQQQSDHNCHRFMSMRVIKDRSQRQKVVHGTDMELEGVVMEAQFSGAS